MKKACIIYNPTAGSEIFKKELPVVLDRCENAGYETSTYATTGEGDAVREAQSASINYFDLIIVAGGDGKINEVVHGLADLDYRTNVYAVLVGTTIYFV